jgi:hypothetical protein
MVSPARRTWLLATLDRDCSWRLWFDRAARRWEVERLVSDVAAPAPPVGPPPASEAPAGVRAGPQPSAGTWSSPT